MRWLGIFAGLCATLSATGANAGSIDFNTSAGDSLFTERFSVDTRPNSRRESGIVGDGGFTLANAGADYPAFGHVIDHTYAFSGSVGWKFDRSWEAGLMLALSSTPAENLQQGGGTLYGEYTHYFGGERGTVPAAKREPRKPATEAKRSAPGGPASGAAGDQEFPADFLAEETSASGSSTGEAPHLFQPSLGGRLLLGRSHMTDRPNAVLRALFPSLADVIDELNQRFLTLEISGQPWRWFGARLSLTAYSYDRDVNEFLAFLSDRRSLGASSFAASVNGLPKSSSALGLYFYPSDDWEVDWIGNSSRSLSSGATSRGTQLLVTHDFTNWLRIGLGVERDVSDDIAQSLLLLNFSFAI